jgi:hypothetical protein
MLQDYLFSDNSRTLRFTSTLFGPKLRTNPTGLIVAVIVHKLKFKLLFYCFN